MTLDFGTTVALFSFLVGIPVLVFFTNNFYERTERKIAKIRMGIFGSLNQPLKELKELSVFSEGDNEEKQDIVVTEFMTFMRKSVLSSIIWDFQDLIDYQKDLESQVNRILFIVPFFTLPGILFQIDAYFGLGGLLFYILSLIIMFPVARTYRILSGIKKLLIKYVIEKESFGEYD